MSAIELFLQELEQEAQTTRRVLERVPGDQLAWKPHDKSTSLGQLALHIAPLPVPRFEQPSAKTATELVPALEQSLAKARSILEKLDDADLAKIWRVVD